MIPEYLASDEVPHPFAQSHSGNFLVSGVMQLSFTCDETIDPMLLMGGNHEFPRQGSPSPNSAYYPEGDHYQHTSPAPSTSDGVWMGYPSYEASASAPIPISPTVGNRVSALARYDAIVLC